MLLPVGISFYTFHTVSYTVDVCGATCCVSVVAFAVQIYGDFAGYTLIARGISQFLGIPLIENFHMPYLAVDPRDFWRRWHISLSLWLRNYLYLSLGGSRNGKARTYFNLMATMLLGGLWHGASWTFVLWGGYHGVLLCICQTCGLSRKTDHPVAWRRVVRIVLTFLLTHQELRHEFRPEHFVGAAHYGAFASAEIGRRLAEEVCRLLPPAGESARNAAASRGTGANFNRKSRTVKRG